MHSTIRSIQPLDAQNSYAYLQAIGIKLWVPRVQLPNAAPSQECAWQEATPPPSSKPAQKARAALASSAVPASPAPATVCQPIAQNTQSSMPNVAAYVQAPLNLRVQQLSNSWLLVLPQQISPKALKLLQNLQLGLHQQTLGIVQQKSFIWPLPNLPSTPSQEEASLSLLAFATGANFNPLQPQGCLIFAPEAYSLIEKLTHLQPNFFYTAPCLEQLLRQPHLKQDFWRYAQANGLLTHFRASQINI